MVSLSAFFFAPPYVACTRQPSYPSIDSGGNPDGLIQAGTALRGRKVQPACITSVVMTSAPP